MNRSENTYQREVLPAVRYRARLVFRGKRDRSELENDAASVAWEMYSRAPDKPVSSIAYYACKQALCGRQFRQSSRSIDGPNPLKRKKHQRVAAELGKLAGRERNNPADIATLLVDYREWLTTLTPEERELLQAFLIGEATKEIARRLHVSPGRVSQMRHELVTYWMAFTSE